ncbi:MAG: hypothetical protein COB08_005725 [Rhodobacteraceae bacterium]|nr:hypothetical protein [Paracoccaceae bacterium]
MKLIFATFAAIASATSAFAGAVTYIAPEVVAIEEPARMGGSGAWLIPLIIAAVILLAVTKSDTAPTEAR